MKFTAKEDIEAPIDFVFEQMSDFDAMQRAAIRRGATVQRKSGAAQQPGVGMAWHVAFDLRGRRREADVELVEYDPPNGTRFEAKSQGLDASCWIELIPLSPHRTRMKLHLELKPQTLSARLLVQSLKLAKGNLTKRVEGRVADYARTVEDRNRRIA